MAVTAQDGFVHADDGTGTAAGRALVKDAADGMEQADFGIVFCSSVFDIEAFVDGVNEQMQSLGADWVGCTTAGELSAAGSTTGGAVALLIDTDEMAFTVVVESDIHQRPVDAGRDAAQRIYTDEFRGEDRDTLLYALFAGLTQKHPGVGDEVLDGITDIVGIEVPVVGGAAGDDIRLRQTYQFHNGTVYRDALVLTGIASDLPLVVGQENGLNRIIESGVINEVDGRVVKQINGQPAARFYADAIGVSVDELAQLFDLPLRKQVKAAAYYLWLKLTGQDPTKIQRIFQYSLEHSFARNMGGDNLQVVTPYAITDDGGVVMTVRLHEHQPIHIIEGDKEDIINAGQDAFPDVDPEDAVFAVLSDCTCRNQTLSEEERDEEVQRLRAHLGCPLIGFYGYGEIGGKDKALSTFQNQTVSGFVVLEEQA